MRALQQAEQTGDVEPLVQMFTDEAELRNLATAQPLKGVDGARQFWRDYLSAFQRIHSHFTDVLEHEGRAALEWISEGVLCNGEPITYRGISILEAGHGRVRRFRAYYDSAAFLPHGSKDRGRNELGSRVA